MKGIEARACFGSAGNDTLRLYSSHFGWHLDLVSGLMVGPSCMSRGMTKKGKQTTKIFSCLLLVM